MKQYEQISFHQETESETLAREVKLLKEQCEKIRKKQFAEIGKMRKLYEEIKSDHEYFKASICKSKNNSSFI